jgi:hypothetical protein
MSNKHYYIDEEFEVTLKVKVKNIRMSNYHGLSPEEQKEAMVNFKKEISKHLEEKLLDGYSFEEVYDSDIYFSYDIE